MIREKDSAPTQGALREKVRAEAEAFYALNYNVLPAKADGSKAPVGSWKRWQTERIPRSEFDTWRSRNYHGYMLVTGIAFDGQLPVELFELRRTMRSRRRTPRRHGRPVWASY